MFSNLNRKGSFSLLPLALAAVAVTRSIATGAQDLYVANAGGSISEFSSSGAFLGSFADPGGPVGIALNSSGDIFTSNFNSGTVVEYSPGGSLLQTIATGLDEPFGIAVDASGNVYVGDFSSHIYKFSSTGALLESIGASGEVSQPWSLAIDAAGNLFSTDHGGASGYVCEYTPDLTLLNYFYVMTDPSGHGNANGMAIDSAGDIYVAEDETTGTLAKYTSSGTFLGNIATGLISNLAGVAVDANDNVYVTIPGQDLIEVYSSTGTYEGDFATTNLDDPYGMVFSPASSSTGTPEPSSLVIFGIGALMFARRRFARRRAPQDAR